MISPRLVENPPRYHTGNDARLSRADGPEDDGVAGPLPARRAA
jgi:hypothetical protein